MAGKRPIGRGDGAAPISRQCEGHVDDGDGTSRRCRRSASHGTNVCTSHGAAAPQVRRKAAERVEQAKVLDVFEKWSPNGDTAPVDVVSELIDLVREVRQFRDFLRDRVEELAALTGPDHLGDERIRAVVVLLERAMDRSGRLLTDVVGLGLEERAVAIAAQRARLHRVTGEAVARALEAVLDSMGLSDDQRRTATARLAAGLMHLEPGDG